MTRRIITVFILFMGLFIFSDEVSAGTYDNAYSYYMKFGDDSTAARFNEDDGYIYFCSMGSTSVTQTKYRTVGYQITINVGSRTDTIEVLLGGTYVKNVSEVSKSGYTYVLRRAKFSKLLSLFSGNGKVTWNEIYRKNNIYTFNAIMTVYESGKLICGNIYEQSGYRKISADKDRYLYRRLADIKAARKWANPDDLNSFFNKNVTFPARSNIKTKNVYVTGNNVYAYNGLYYAKEQSMINISFQSYFYDTDAANKKYHPNYNIYSITGWGDNQKYYTSQKKTAGAAPLSGILKDENTSDKPFSFKETVISATTGFSDCNYMFSSMIAGKYNVPDGNTIYVKPEGRVYYNYNYPKNINDTDNMCDISKNNETVEIISDGKGPEVYVPTVVLGSKVCYVPVSANDYGSGLQSIRLYRDDGVLISEQTYSGRTISAATDRELFIRNPDGHRFYVNVTDNVGNSTKTGYITIIVPKAYNVEATVTGYINGYNASNITVDVFGGNSEISAFVIMSEDDNNAARKRIIFENKSVEAKTLSSGLYKYHYTFNPSDFLKYYPDGTYIIDVISGGRYISSEPVSIQFNKDKTKPVINVRDKFDENKWYKDNITLEFEASDSYSGIQQVCARIDNEEADGTSKRDIFMGYTLGTYEITEEGVHNIEMTAQDRAGNIAKKYTSCKIDKTPVQIVPGGAFVGLCVPNDIWINREKCKSPIYLTDELSGVLDKQDIADSNKYDFDYVSDNKVNVSFSDAYADTFTNGSCQKNIVWSDKAGNKALVKLYLNIDCEPPVVSAAETDGWQKDKLKGSFSISDVHSGIDSVEIYENGEIYDSYYDINQKSYTVSIDRSENLGNPLQLLIKVTDRAGNTTEYVPECGGQITLTAKIERNDGNPEPVFKRGEKGKLTVHFTGAADELRIYYPDCLTKVNPSLNRVYNIKGKDKFIINTEVPVFIDTPEDDYYITVQAVKGDYIRTVTPEFKVIGSVTEQFRTRLR